MAHKQNGSNWNKNQSVCEIGISACFICKCYAVNSGISSSTRWMVHGFSNPEGAAVSTCRRCFRKVNKWKQPKWPCVRDSDDCRLVAKLMLTFTNSSRTLIFQWNCNYVQLLFPAGADPLSKQWWNPNTFHPIFIHLCWRMFRMQGNLILWHQKRYPKRCRIFAHIS